MLLTRSCDVLGPAHQYISSVIICRVPTLAHRPSRSDKTKSYSFDLLNMCVEHIHYFDASRFSHRRSLPVRDRCARKAYVRNLNISKSVSPLRPLNAGRTNVDKSRLQFCSVERSGRTDSSRPVFCLCRTDRCIHARSATPSSVSPLSSISPSVNYASCVSRIGIRTLSSYLRIVDYNSSRKRICLLNIWLRDMHYALVLCVSGHADRWSQSFFCERIEARQKVLRAQMQDLLRA